MVRGQDQITTSFAQTRNGNMLLNNEAEDESHTINKRVDSLEDRINQNQAEVLHKLNSLSAELSIMKSQ